MTFPLLPMAYLLLAGIIMLVNLLPAFAPPTWAILVVFITQNQLSVPLVILCGVVAATLGRWILSNYTSWLARHTFNANQEQNLAYLGQRLGNTKTANFLFITLYCLTPLSSAALFIAAGMINMNRGVLLGGFFLGRLVSYSVLVTAASTLATNLQDITEPGGITVLGVIFSILAVAALALFVCIDWRVLMEKKKLQFQWKIFAFQK